MKNVGRARCVDGHRVSPPTPGRKRNWTSIAVRRGRQVSAERQAAHRPPKLAGRVADCGGRSATDAAQRPQPSAVVQHPYL